MLPEALDFCLQQVTAERVDYGGVAVGFDETRVDGERPLELRGGVPIPKELRGIESANPIHFGTGVVDGWRAFEVVLENGMALSEWQRAGGPLAEGGERLTEERRLPGRLEGAASRKWAAARIEGARW